MIAKRIELLDPDRIAASGQTFRWRCEDGVYTIPAFSRVLKMKREGDMFLLSCTDDEWDGVWSDYFDMSTDYAGVEKRILEKGDGHLIRAYRHGRGIRILRQELWETIITFMISQNNNIPRIKKSVELICERFGTDLGDGIRSFPGSFDVPEEAFDDPSLGLGYRNVYLREMFGFVREHRGWLDELKTADHDESVKMLCERKGIGKKVAECIALFGLHHTRAFPVDTHVKQLMEKYYPRGLDLKGFEDCAGILQQFLFYYELNN